MCINLFWFISLSEGHGAAESAPMVIEATPFAKSSSNGDNGSGWSIKRLAYPENVLSLLLSFMSFHVQGGRSLSKWLRYDLLPLLTAQNYCNFSKLPTFYPLICIVSILKASFTPPDLDLHQPLDLVLPYFPWNGNNGHMLKKCPKTNVVEMAEWMRSNIGLVHWCFFVDHRSLMTAQARSRKMKT